MPPATPLVTPPVTPPVTHQVTHPGHTSLLSYFSGFCPIFREYWKIVLEKLQILGISAKMRQIRSFCGILQFPPKNVPNFPFFPENVSNFTIFVGVFVKFYYFSSQKVPNFNCFPQTKSQITLFLLIPNFQNL